MFHRATFLSGSVLLLLAVGLACATTQSRPQWVRTGDPVIDGWTAITNGPIEDRVLWQYRTGLELIRRGDYVPAERLFDDALAVVAGRFGQDKKARQSRGLFGEEEAKTYIGEPYERAMAYYYRGLLYWRAGELDNARACFRSAQIEDSDTEGQEYASDFVLMDYLDGLASYRLNGGGGDAYLRATNSAKWVIPDPYEKLGRVLIFADYGRAPEKFAVGQYREKLKFRDAGSPVTELIVRSGNQSVHLGAADDLAYQSSTRGGRVMDHVLANKAVFKGATDAVGDAALIGGLILAQDRNTQEVGLGLAAFGLVSKLVSSATTPQADTRAWDNLPKFLAFGSLNLPPGEHELNVEFLNDQRQVVPRFSKRLPIQVNGGGLDTVVILSALQTQGNKQ